MKKTRKFNVVLTEEQYQFIINLAAEKDISMAEAIRVCVENKLRK